MVLAPPNRPNTDELLAVFQRGSPTTPRRGVGQAVRGGPWPGLVERLSASSSLRFFSGLPSCRSLSPARRAVPNSASPTMRLDGLLSVRSAGCSLRWVQSLLSRRRRQRRRRLRNEKQRSVRPPCSYAAARAGVCWSLLSSTDTRNSVARCANSVSCWSPMEASGGSNRSYRPSGPRRDKSMTPGGTGKQHNLRTGVGS